jgi:hypothetical protein
VRPESIRQFEYFYLASIALAVLNIALSYGQASFTISYLFGSAGRIPGMSTAIAAIFAASAGIGLLFAFLIPMTLWYLAARRASQTARWIIVALGALSAVRLLLLLFVLGWLIVSKFPVEGWVWYSMMIGIVSETLHMAAIYFLFPADSREWFDRGRSPARTQDIFS